jgi:hypothetical protein
MIVPLKYLLRRLALRKRQAKSCPFRKKDSSSLRTSDQLGKNKLRKLPGLPRFGDVISRKKLLSPRGKTTSEKMPPKGLFSLYEIYGTIESFRTQTQRISHPTL